MHGEASDPGTRLRASGWCQGSVVDKASLEALGYGDTECAVVISQDCDVVQCVTVESYVEVIEARVVAEPRADLLNGRNPRLLNVPLFGGGPPFLHLSVHDRFRIEKEHLAVHVPSSTIALDAEATSLLAKWIAKRYTRVAWPDEFNRRLAAIDEKLERLFKGDRSKPITGIWLMLDPPGEELSADRDYRLAVWLTMTSESMMDKDEYQRAEQFEKRL